MQTPMAVSSWFWIPPAQNGSGNVVFLECFGLGLFLLMIKFVKSCKTEVHYLLHALCSYVSAMVPVKSPKEYYVQQEVIVLFCETVER